MERAAISIDDPGNNIGRGRVENLIVDRCGQGIEANDAYGFEVVNGFISRCPAAFWAYNHVYFRLRNAVIWDCQTAFAESLIPVQPPRSNVIAPGRQVVVLADLPAADDPVLEGLRTSTRFFGAPRFGHGRSPGIRQSGHFLGDRGGHTAGQGGNPAGRPLL